MAQYDQWPTEQWGRNIGYVAQEIKLFPGTIADNIARFDIEFDEQAVYESAKSAGVHEMILGLPNGYQSIVGMGELDLSAGQKQNIALARALYGNPKVLILDEPNAHLDQSGEGMLFNALVNAKKRGAAVVVVSQRTSILKIADRTLRITNGRAELMEPAKMQGNSILSAEMKKRRAASIQNRDTQREQSIARSSSLAKETAA